MATTTNYGWTTPDDTGLVKDGASAIRSLGTSVDTTTKNLNPETTLGDIAYRSSTANVKTRLGIGTTGQILTVAGGVPTWAAPAAGGGFTSLASITPSTAAQSLTSISGSYKHLCLVFQDVYGSSDNQGISMTLNDLATNTYSFARLYDGAGTYGSSNSYATSSISPLGITASATTTDKVNGVMWFYNYTSAESKLCDWKFFYNRSTAGSFFVMGSGINTTSSAINKITFTLGGGTFSGGTMQLYGVN